MKDVTTTQCGENVFIMIGTFGTGTISTLWKWKSPSGACAVVVFFFTVGHK